MRKAGNAKRLRGPTWLATTLTFTIGIGLASFAGTTGAMAGNKTPLRHVIVIMQENRSFDHYFGTFPGADGIPQGTCVPLKPGADGPCVKPFHDIRDVNVGGPHGGLSARIDIDDGISQARMDGFVAQQLAGAFNPSCPPGAMISVCVLFHEGALRHDAMGYHTEDELPNYWRYARNFVLQDRLFAGVRDWSLGTHLDLVSEWVAACTDKTDARTCRTDHDLPIPDNSTEYPWASLFELLDAKKVTWKYYLTEGLEPDCADGEMTCEPQRLASKVPSQWNPGPYFSYVKKRGAAYLGAHNVAIDQLLVDLHTDQLPQVAWVMPSSAFSEHPSAGVTAGMEYVTSVINAVMQSPAWTSTAIFLSWDDWGGFYDHVVPPNVDRNVDPHDPIHGYGLRVPGLMISAYARKGMIDHAVYSFDSYATFFEDLFADGTRLDPALLGNPDSRPLIRDAVKSVTFPDGHSEPVGDLISEFDFGQPPRPPLIMSTHIPTDLRITCNDDKATRCTTETVTISWLPIARRQVRGKFTYQVFRDGHVLPHCLHAAGKCQDSPGAGTHIYTALSIDRKGVSSPRSAAAIVTVP